MYDIELIRRLVRACRRIEHTLEFVTDFLSLVAMLRINMELRQEIELQATRLGEHFYQTLTADTWEERRTLIEVFLSLYPAQSV